MARVEASLSGNPLKQIHQSLDNSVLRVIADGSYWQDKPNRSQTRLRDEEESLWRESFEVIRRLRGEYAKEVVQGDVQANPKALLRGSLIPSPEDPDFDAFCEYIGLGEKPN